MQQYFLSASPNTRAMRNSVSNPPPILARRQSKMPDVVSGAPLPPADYVLPDELILWPRAF